MIWLEWKYETQVFIPCMIEKSWCLNFEDMILIGLFFSYHRRSDVDGWRIWSFLIAHVEHFTEKSSTFLCVCVCVGGEEKIEARLKTWFYCNFKKNKLIEIFLKLLWRYEYQHGKSILSSTSSSYICMHFYLCNKDWHE